MSNLDSLKYIYELYPSDPRLANFNEIRTTTAPKFDRTWRKLSGTDLTARWLATDPDGSVVHTGVESVVVAPGSIVTVSHGPEGFRVSIPRRDDYSEIEPDESNDTESTASSIDTVAPVGRPRATANVAELRAMRQAGATYREIAAATGVSPMTIHRLLKQKDNE